MNAEPSHRASTWSLRSALAGAVAAAVVAGLWSGATPRAQAPQGPTLDERVAALERALADEEAQHAETRALLDTTLIYLDAQSQAANKLLAVLDQAEAEGFTAGINFRSRELLLAGFRAYWGTKGKGLPEPKTPPQAQEAGRVGARDASERR